MAAPPVRPHGLHVIRFTSQRFFDAPATIELPQFQLHGMLCEAGRIRVASWWAVHTVDLDEGRRPASRSETAYEAAGRIPAEFTGLAGPRNLGWLARLDTALRARFPLFEDRGHTFAIEVEPVRESIRTCSHVSFTRLVERDAAGALVRFREIVRGAVGRECGELSRESLNRFIPPADPALYAGVRSASEWRNPVLVVFPDAVELRVQGPDAGVRRIALEELRHALTGLALGAWPYGRVVAVTNVGILSSRDDEARIDRLTNQILDLARSLGLEVVRWPSAPQMAGPPE